MESTTEARYRLCLHDPDELEGERIGVGRVFEEHERGTALLVVAEYERATAFYSDEALTLAIFPA